MKRTHTAPVLFACGTVLSLGGAYLLKACQPLGPGFEPWFFSGLSAMACGMLLLWHYHPEKLGLPTILLLALLLRIAFLSWPHNSDLNRYIWEGCMQNVGLSPYLIAPSAVETEPFRNLVWEGVNFKDYPSLYGPLAQFIFRAAALTSDPAAALKLLFLTSDMGVLWLLLLALQKHGMARRHGWLYAAHPLPILLLVGEGHLEPLLVLPLFAGFLAIHWGYARGGLLLVGLAMTVKISIAMLIPFALRRVPKKIWPMVVLPLLLWLPFDDGFFAHLKVLTTFVSSETFNSLVQTISKTILPSAAGSTVAAATFILGYCYLWVLDPQHLRAVLLVQGLLLLCSPVVHPWYFAVLLPFAVLYRSLPWLVLCTTTTLLLYVTLHFIVSEDWRTPSWLFSLEFVPFFMTLAFCACRRPSPLAPSCFAKPTHLSILLPVRNETENIQDCLKAIAIPTDIPAEILVIDGGSSDNTLALAGDDPRVRCLQSFPGRGTQIATGYRQAQGDLLVIIHADTRLGPDTIQHIWQHCIDNAHVAGGACTARYNHPALRFRVTEMLNDLRVLWCGIAFGDQVQFFRRAAISPEAFPDFRLMEDIELSIETRHAGALAFIRTQVFASHRRWEKVGYSRNTLQVICLFTVYMILRSIGLVRDKGEAFYRYYYGKR
ncbi:MAG: glycosyltransferase [Proteobacteria bacterium]|nr:glycosyltransferase [Pseudomonadota bacterium]